MRGVTGSVGFLLLSKRFLLTRLMRGVTAFLFRIYQIRKFLLTRLMRGVTIKQFQIQKQRRISTHTPHARRDGAIGFLTATLFNFYSHASCEA